MKLLFAIFFAFNLLASFLAVFVSKLAGGAGAARIISLWVGLKKRNVIHVNQDALAAFDAFHPYHFSGPASIPDYLYQGVLSATEIAGYFLCALFTVNTVIFAILWFKWRKSPWRGSSGSG